MLFTNHMPRCRCKRIAGHVSMLADALAATHPDIVVGRVNCEREEYFCAHVIKISRTPSFKVGAVQLAVAAVCGGHTAAQHLGLGQPRGQWRQAA